MFVLNNPPVCGSSVSHFWIISQIEEARNKVSEKSAHMYNSVLEAHEEVKSLDKENKVIMKDVQNLHKEKETLDKRRTEALEMLAQKELDVRDLEDKKSVNLRAKVWFSPVVGVIALEISAKWLCWYLVTLSGVDSVLRKRLKDNWRAWEKKFRNPEMNWIQ